MAKGQKRSNKEVRKPKAGSNKKLPPLKARNRSAYQAPG